MEQGRAFHEAAKRAGLEISQSTAYRLRQSMPQGGEHLSCRSVFFARGSSAFLVLLAFLRADVQEETEGSTMATGAHTPPIR